MVRSFLAIGVFLVCPASTQAQRSDTGKEAREALTVADELFRERKHKEAEAKYREAIAQDPQFEEAYRSYLAFLFYMSNYRRGVEVARQGLRARPDSTLIMGLLGMHLYELGQLKEAHQYLSRKEILGAASRFEVQSIAGRCCIQVKDYVCAAVALKNYLAHRPSSLAKRDFVFQMPLARAQFQLGRYKRAEKTLNRVLEKNPDHLPALILMAAIDLKRGACQEAIKAYKMLRQRMKRHQFIALQIDMARAFACKKRYHEALREIDSYLGAYPKNVDGLLLKADTAYQLKRYAMALENYTQLSKLTEAAPHIRLRIAKTFYYQKHYGRALSTAEALVMLPDVATEARILAIRAGIRTRKKDLALKYAQLLLSEESKSLEHYYYGAMAHGSIGRFDQAIELYKQAITQDPKHAPSKHEYTRALVYKARRLFRQKDLEQAIVYLQLAHAQDPGSRAVNQNLALCYYQLGQDDRVLTHLKPILDKNPRDLAANRMAARALLRQKKPKEALARIDRVIQVTADNPKANIAPDLVVSANIRFALGRFKSGFEQLERAMDLAWEGNQDALIQTIGRNLARAYVMSAYQQLDAGKNSKAWADLSRALQRSTDLPAEEKMVVQAAASIGALAAGKNEEAQKILSSMRTKLTKVLLPPFSKLGRKYLSAYGEYLSPEPEKKTRAARQFEALARKMPEKQAAESLRLAANAYDQIAAMLARRGNAKRARKAIASAWQLAQKTKTPLTAAHQLNSAVIDYMTGKKAEAIKSLSALKSKLALVLCNLAVHHERAGENQKAFAFFSQCLQRGGGGYPGLKAIVESKRRIYGGGGQ